MATLGASGIPTLNDPPVITTRVRVQEPELAGLVREGLDRSETFRRLVQHINETDGIAYIQTGTCPISAAAGCLLLGITEAGRERYLRILVTSRPTRPERRIAIVGHELQHSYEILSRSSVRSTAEAYALFIRIGSVGSIRSFETGEAQDVERAIVQELATPSNKVR